MSIGIPVNLEEYAICQKRGHTVSNNSYGVGPIRWSVCKHCGMQYRYESKLVEAGDPIDQLEDVPTGPGFNVLMEIPPEAQPVDLSGFDNDQRFPAKDSEPDQWRVNR